MKLALCCLFLAGVAAVGAASAGAATRDCGTLSVGPAAPTGSTAGPACLLRAYRACAAAQFTLSRHGVDTVETDVFVVARRSSGCRLAVTASYRVVPQQPRVSRTTCRAVTRRGADVVAVGCGDPLPATVTLNR